MPEKKRGRCGERNILTNPARGVNPGNWFPRRSVLRQGEHFATFMYYAIVKIRIIPTHYGRMTPRHAKEQRLSELLGTFYRVFLSSQRCQSANDSDRRWAGRINGRDVLPVAL